MRKLRIGIICPSDIASRRFLPALAAIDNVEFCGTAVNSADERFGIDKPSKDTVNSMLEAETKKARLMLDGFGGELFSSYSEIVHSPDIDALYIPLPPALHYKWAKMALESGKHVLVEKPATISLKTTDKLIKQAKDKELALHENYMFIFHNQLKEINQIVASGELGEIRLYKISFGFPMRACNDFRYNRALGGGALLDAGGYTIKCASYFLGDTAKVVYAKLNKMDSFEVDMYGSGAMINDQGVTAQISFGMDNEYKCELEIWGSKGILTTGRILTAPTGFVPVAHIIKGGKEEIINLSADDAFKKSIQQFVKCVEDDETRKNNYTVLYRQAELVQTFMDMGKNEDDMISDLA